MNAQQAMALCRYVKAQCPQQKIDEYTPDAWGDTLADIDFDVAKEAARSLAERQVFIAPSEIRTEVARVYRERLQGFASRCEPPRELADDPQREIVWIERWRTTVAQGGTVEDAEAASNAEIGLTPRPKLAAPADADARLVIEEITRSFRSDE